MPVLGMIFGIIVACIERSEAVTTSRTSTRSSLETGRWSRSTEPFLKVKVPFLVIK